MKNKIALIVGTRPEVIKIAPVYFALQESKQLQPVLISTGQHRQMLDQACRSFNIIPDIDLNLMSPSQRLDDLSSRIISSCGSTFRELNPTAVVVQGDTASVLGSALAAFYERIPIGHIEAGLRTYDLSAPWPEEMNRRLVAPICQWCFAPTKECKQNLLSERIDPEKIYITGNTVVDSLYWTKKNIQSGRINIHENLNNINSEFKEKFLSLTASTENRLILVTGHRRESFGRGFENICWAIRRIVEKYPSVGVIYPVHLNPAVQEPVYRILGGNSRIQLTPPVDYQTFVWLMDRSYFIVTDSGGVQEEAPSLGKPILVTRNTTERPEGISAGTSRLVGTETSRIMDECSILLEDVNQYSLRAQLKNPYGDGKAGANIASILEKSY
jgi:UDP-N-acetylglucosamine 2-epimerase